MSLDAAIGRCYGTLPSGVQRRIDRLRASPLASRLIRASFWSLAGSAISRALALAAAVFAARLLGKSAYGELGILQSTVAMFGTLAGFGMGTTATKCVAELRANDPGRAGRVIGLAAIVSWVMSSLLALLLVVAAPWLSNHTLLAPHLTSYLQVGAVLLLLNGVNGAQNGALAGFESFKTIARVSAITGLLNFPLVVGGAYFFGLGGVVAVSHGSACPSETMRRRPDDAPAHANNRSRARRCQKPRLPSMYSVEAPIFTSAWRG